MESALTNMLDMELKCPICLDIFNDPVILPCRHNFCRECINAVWTLGCPLGRCPICMRAYRRKPHLLENFHLVSLVSQYQNLKPHKFKQCRLCRGQPGDFVVKECLTCNESCCHDHIETHLSNPCPFPGHLMVNIDELENWTCSEHGEYKLLYCENEQITLCRSCSRTSCSTHTICSANEKLVGMKERLNLLEHDLNIFNFVISDELKEMRKNQRHVMETLHARKGQVKNHFERMQNQALEMLNNFKVNYELTHTQHYQDVRTRHTKIRNLLSSTTMCLRQVDKSKFLKRGPFHQELITHGNVEENYAIPPFKMNPPNLTEILSTLSTYEGPSTQQILKPDPDPGCSTFENHPAPKKKKLKVPHTTAHPSVRSLSDCTLESPSTQDDRTASHHLMRDRISSDSDSFQENHTTSPPKKKSRK